MSETKTLTKTTWKQGENSEQNYWSRGSIDIIQIKLDLKEIFRVEFIGGRGKNGSSAYRGHYPTVEDAMNNTNHRDWKIGRGD